MKNDSSCLCTDRMMHFFKAGGDEHRQQIIQLIGKYKTLNASSILQHLSISQPTLSHHLKILKAAHFVTVEKRGKEVFYSLNSQTITGCCTDLAQEVRHA